jgi:hypothetical protein
VIGFPLLLVPLAIYNMIVFIVPMDWGTKLYTFHLTSKVDWSPTLGDAFLLFSLLLLMFEFIKATNYGKSVVEHLLSIALAGGAAAEFVMVEKAGTSIFMLFVAICFVDMFAGFAAALRRVRRGRMSEVPAPVVAPVVYAPPPPAARTEPRAEPRAEPVIIPPAPQIDPAPSVTPPPAPVQKIEP